MLLIACKFITGDEDVTIKMSMFEGERLIKLWYLKLRYLCNAENGLADEKNSLELLRQLKTYSALS